MEQQFYDDLQSMEIDELQRVPPTGSSNPRLQSRGTNQPPLKRCAVVEISESLVSSPSKSHRKNKNAISQGEVDSNAVHKNTSEAYRHGVGTRLPQSLAKSAPQSLHKSTTASPSSLDLPKPPLIINLARPDGQKPNVSAGFPAHISAKDGPRLDPRATEGLCEKSNVPVLRIADLSDIAPRFVIEGRVLNNYGTYKLRPEEAKFPRYFKVDIVDACNSDTVTVVVEDSLLSHFVPKFPLGKYVRIEGASVKRRNRVDGGTCTYSLHVDSATTVGDSITFPITSSFYPECGIRAFLDEGHLLHTRRAKQHLGTLAFVVVQADNLEAKPGATRGELLVADGRALGDRAILTFVNDRKDEYAKIVRDVEAGSLIMFVARNIGVFMTRDNTLSVLDLTILLGVQSTALQKELLEVYDKHMEFLGFGKEVLGDLTVTNVNDILVEIVCYICKSTKIHRTVDGTYCVSCSKATEALEIPHLHAKISIDKQSTITTQLVGLIIDKVLHLEKPFRQLYSESVLGIREILACTTRTGAFKLNRAGNVCDHRNKEIAMALRLYKDCK